MPGQQPRALPVAAGVPTSAGEAVAQKRRLPGGKGFDFFVESSFVELYNETCRDLYSKSGPAGAPNLPVSGQARLHSTVLFSWRAMVLPGL